MKKNPVLILILSLLPVVLLLSVALFTTPAAAQTQGCVDPFTGAAIPCTPTPAGCVDAAGNPCTQPPPDVPSAIPVILYTRTPLTTPTFTPTVTGTPTRTSTPVFKNTGGNPGLGQSSSNLPAVQDKGPGSNPSFFRSPLGIGIIVVGLLLGLLLGIIAIRRRRLGSTGGGKLLPYMERGGMESATIGGHDFSGPGGSESATLGGHDLSGPGPQSATVTRQDINELNGGSSSLTGNVTDPGAVDPPEPDKLIKPGGGAG